MRFIEIVYTVTKPSHVSIDEIFDMFRYSHDSVLDILSDDSWMMTRIIEYEDFDHLQRRIEFFKTQIMVRWRSFGCEVEVIRGKEYLAS